MAKRIRHRITALVEGLPLANEIEEFTPPEVAAKTDTNEGQFVHDEDNVGIEPLTWSMKVQGERHLLGRLLGDGFAGNGVVNVLERGKNQEGVAWATNYTMIGVIKSCKQDAVKMGEKPTCTIEGTAKIYKEIDNGITIHDINTKTGKTIVFGVDQTGI